MISTLTSKNTFVVFFLVFGIGCFVIWANLYPLYIAISLVVLYTALLFLAQNKYHVALALQVKNSPYFLGFLFTLVALLRVFIDLGVQRENIAAHLSTFLIPQIGTALSTTIVGLVGTHLILSFDPSKEFHEELFQQATDELKENAAAYRIAQQRLLDLINDFVESHTTLLEREQEVSQEHITLLSESSSALAKLGRQYPPKVQQLLGSLDDIQQKLDVFVNDGFPEIINRLNEKTKEHLKEQHNSFLESAKDVAEQMTKNVSAIQDKFEGINNVLDDGFKKSVENIRNSFSEMTPVIASMKENVQKTNEVTTNIVNTFKTTYTEYVDHLKTFRKEIEQIDGLISDFIELTRKRMI